MATEKLKQSLYFSEETLQEIMREANRLDRSLSWTVQQAWRIARDQVRKFPAAHVRRDGAGEKAPPPRVNATNAPAADERKLDGEIRPSEQVLEFLRGKFDRDFSN